MVVRMEARTDTGYELVIGLVAPIGVDLAMVSTELSRAFETVAYRTRVLRLLDLVPGPRVAQSAHLTIEHRYQARMDIGNDFRRALERDDALALLAVAGIRAERKDDSGGDGERPIERCAYILHSLKTTQEVARLREIYGTSCYIVAAYASREHRSEWLAKRIDGSHHSSGWERHRAAAEALILRDEHERIKHGQNVRDTFPLADIFLDATNPERLKKQALRFVALLFGHPFQTPTRDEHGMFQAFGAALRSSSAGRQVGAAIATRDGDVIALGTNEVAKAFGGQYWDEDEPDHRDHRRPADPSAAMTRGMLADMLGRLRKKGWLVEDKTASGFAGMLERAEDELLSPMSVENDDPSSLAESARIKHIIEFIRAVHAEMAALMTAARRGVSVDGSTLYSTSFPCHECARHIVAAGIRRVVFIEPYPKSRVSDLYDDSICVDGSDNAKVTFQAFIGIAPRLYMSVFSMPERKAQDGGWLDWDTVRRTRQPRHAEPSDAYIGKERDYSVLLLKLKKHAQETFQMEVPP